MLVSPAQWIESAISIHISPPSFHPSIYLIICLYQYGLVYLFSTLGCNPIGCYLFCCLNYSNFGHGSSFRLVPVSLWYASILLFFWTHLSFLIPQDAAGVSCVFPAPLPEIAISSKSPGSFNWKMVFRNQDLGAGCAHFFLGPIASGPCQQTELGIMCVY